MKRRLRWLIPLAVLAVVAARLSGALSPQLDQPGVHGLGSLLDPPEPLEPDADGDYKKHLNPHSLEVVTAKLEPSLSGATPADQAPHPRGPGYDARGLHRHGCGGEGCEGGQPVRQGKGFEEGGFPGQPGFAEDLTSCGFRRHRRSQNPARPALRRRPPS